MLAIRPIELDTSVVATAIYGDMPHIVEPLGLVLSSDIRAELQKFMTEFCSFVQVRESDEKYFRLDLYFDGEMVSVIEINVEIADGWGVSLNLLRAAGSKLDCTNVTFPKVIPSFPEDLRQTEFELACDELNKCGYCSEVVVEDSRTFDSLDNKLYLARFAQVWKGERVKVPKMYCNEVCSWDEVPQDVYLKFTDKFCPEAVKSRYSAKPRSELGKAKQMRTLYGVGRAIAQERIEPYRLPDNRQVQAVVMCAGSIPVTGYIQIASPQRHVINDKGTAKGALIFT